MRIEKLEYEDKELEWKLDPIYFSNLTLLVGVSGVGKTQILQAIMSLKRIASGASLNGLKWSIIFTTKDNFRYQWQGEFETKEIIDEIFDEDDEKRFKILNEKLYRDDELIVNRVHSDIIFQNQSTPKLSPYKSVLDILSQEEVISPAHDAFSKIIRSDPSISMPRLNVSVLFVKFDNLVKKYESLEAIQESDLDTHVKLALVYKNVPKVFDKIKERFINTFPQVEDIKLEPVPQQELSRFLAELPLFQIKEKGVNKWIDQRKISSGMLRAITHLSEIYLWPEATVILVDEFENSLGINCIDILTEELLTENRNFQFIITSHHPYIINNIGMEHWKIVTRRGGVVTARDADEFKGLGKSKHDAFIQLMNLEAFQEGIAA